VALSDVVAADFLTIAASIGSESLTHTRTGPGTTSTISTAIVVKTDTIFGFETVPAYNITKFITRFPVSGLSPTPKEGDLITRNGVDYEVTLVEKVVRDTCWRLECSRASINPDYATTVTIKRGTISQNAYGVDVASLSTFIASLSGYMYLGDNVHIVDVLDVIDQIDTGVFYVSGGAQGIMPSDVLVYSGVNYDITDVEKDGRIAQLCELKVKRIQ